MNFLIDKGQDPQKDQEQQKEEYSKLIKYFLTSLTIPEENLWVNLSPYEKDRIASDDLGQTQMGIDLLAQDYLLKQLMASLMYPEDQLGKRFWERVYKKAWEKYQTTEIPINTFNKVWIVPDKTIVYEQGDTAWVLYSRLKVMLEADYRAQKLNDLSGKEREPSGIEAEIIREVLIPEIEKEVNEGSHFAPLRQIVHSMILATWYKRALKASVLGKAYINQGKISGVETDDVKNKLKIYDQYIDAFKKGVFNYIKEDYDTNTQQMIPRKYFSGGFAYELGQGYQEVAGVEEVPQVLRPRVTQIYQQLKERGIVSVNTGFEIKFVQKGANKRYKEYLGRGGTLFINTDIHENDLDIEGSFAHGVSHALFFHHQKNNPAQIEKLGTAFQSAPGIEELLQQFFALSGHPSREWQLSDGNINYSRILNEILAMRARHKLLAASLQDQELTPKMKDELARYQSFAGSFEEQFYTPHLIALQALGFDNPAANVAELDPAGIEQGIAICDRMDLYDRLTRQKAVELDKDKVTQKEIDEAAEKLEEDLKEFDELMEDYAEEVDKNSDDDMETEVTDQEKHELRDIAAKTLIKYLSSGKQDKSFEEFFQGVMGQSQRVFSHDNAEKVKKLFNSSGVKDKLSALYKKGEKEISGTALDHGGENPPKAVAQTMFGQKAQDVLSRLGLGGHQHKSSSPIEAGTEEDIVSQYTNDLNELSRLQKIDDTYYLEEGGRFIDGRVAMESANNVLIVGDPDVGMGLVEGLIVRSTEEQTPLTGVKGMKFLEFNTARLVDSLVIPGQIEDEVKQFIEAVKRVYKNQRVGLVFDFQDFYQIGEMKGKMIGSLPFILKEAIENPNISVIGVANQEVYKEVFEKERRIANTFGVYKMKSLPTYDIKRIVTRFVRKVDRIYQKFIPEGVKIKIDRTVIEQAIELTSRHLASGSPPTKLQDVLDGILMEKLLGQAQLNAQEQEMADRIRTITNKLKEAYKANDQVNINYFESILDQEIDNYRNIVQKIKDSEVFLQKIKERGEWVITVDEIARKIAEEANIPLEVVMATEDDKIATYRESMLKMLIGQDEAVAETNRALLRRRGRNPQDNKPIGSFIFIGPTGVGKTELARAMARHMSGSEEALVRMDMSEYMNPGDYLKLIGAPPGYISYENGGILTNHVLRRPYSVVLFDEIEKAHPETFDLLLQVLFEGELKDNKGRIANFKNTIILMTSNIGFSQDAREDLELKKKIEELIKSLEFTKRELATQADSNLKEQLRELQSRFQRLEQDIKAGGTQPDQTLVSILAKIDDLFSTEKVFDEHKQERLEYLTALHENIIASLKKGTDLNVKQMYEIMARLKESDAAQDPALGELVRSELELRRQLFFYRLSVADAQRVAEPGYRHDLAQYTEISRILDLNDIRAAQNHLINDIRNTVRDRLIASIRQQFKPELLGRVGEANVIAFNPLSQQDLEKILDIKLGGLNAQLKEQGYGALTIDKALRDKIIEQGYDVVNGARPLVRALRRIVTVPLAEKILSQQISKGAEIKAEFRAGKVQFLAKQTKGKSLVYRNEAAISRMKNLLLSSAAPLDFNEVLITLGLEKIFIKRRQEDKGVFESFRINLPGVQGAEESVELDQSNINEKLVEINLMIKESEKKIRRYQDDLNLADTDAKRQIISQNLRNEQSKSGIMQKKLQRLEEIKKGDISRARQLLEEEKTQQQQEQTMQEKQINESFENLTIEASEGQVVDLHPPLDDVLSLARILNRQRRNYVFIQSESLLAQKMVVDSLAAKIATGQIEGFANKRLLRLDLGKLVKYFSVAGAFEARIKELVDAIEADDKVKGLETTIVLDFDDIKKELALIRGNPFLLGFFLRLFKGKETIRFVMTTSRQDITTEESFDKYFTLLSLKQESFQDVLKNMALYVKEDIERKNNGTMNTDRITIKLDAIEVAVKIWERYLRGEPAQEKIREWFNAVFIKKQQAEDKLMGKLRETILNITEEFAELLAESGEIQAQDIRNSEYLTGFIREIQTLEEKLKEARSITITRQDVVDYVLQETDLKDSNVGLLLASENENLRTLDLEASIGLKIVGQPEAIKEVVDVIKVAKAGLKPKDQPIGSFIFAGPTGVGKTQLGKIIALETGMRFFRVDVSGLKSREDVTRLIGPPPGTVGSDETEGELVEYIRKYPNTVVMFDEIEKGDPQVLDLLLQVLEDGRLTSNKGTTAKFGDTIVILSTNLGMEGLYDQLKEAVESNDPAKIDQFIKKMRPQVETAFKLFFRPEFLNRIDARVVFNPLSYQQLVTVARIAVEREVSDIERTNKIAITRPGEASVDRMGEHLIKNGGYHPRYGARPLEQIVERQFADRLIAFMTSQPRTEDEQVEIVVDNEGKIDFQLARKVASADSIQKASEYENKIVARMVEWVANNEGKRATNMDIEHILDLRTDVKAGAGKSLEFLDPVQAAVTTNNDFLRKDRAVNEAIDGILNGLPESTGSLETIGKTVASWVKGAVRLGKMANVEGFAWKKNKEKIDHFDKLVGEDMKEAIERYVQQMGDGANEVKISWEYRGDRLLLSVIYNNPMRRDIHASLFDASYASEEDVLEKAPKFLQGLLKDKLALEQLGANVGYYAGKIHTELWVSLPLTDSPESKPTQAATLNPEEALQKEGYRKKISELENRIALIDREIFPLNYQGLVDPAEMEKLSAELREWSKYDDWISFELMSTNQARLELQNEMDRIKPGKMINLFYGLSLVVRRDNELVRSRIAAAIGLGNALKAGAELTAATIVNLSEAVGDPNENVAMAAGQALLKGLEARNYINDSFLKLSGIAADRTQPVKNRIIAITILGRALKAGVTLDDVSSGYLSEAVGDLNENVATAAGQALSNGIGGGSKTFVAFSKLVALAANRDKPVRSRIIAIAILGRAMEGGVGLSGQTLEYLGETVGETPQDLAMAAGQVLLKGLETNATNITSSFSRLSSIVANRNKPPKNRIMAVMILTRAKEMGWILEGNTLYNFQRGAEDIQEESEKELSRKRALLQEKSILQNQIKEIEETLRAPVGDNTAINKKNKGSSVSENEQKIAYLKAKIKLMKQAPVDEWKELIAEADAYIAQLERWSDYEGVKLSLLSFGSATLFDLSLMAKDQNLKVLQRISAIMILGNFAGSGTPLDSRTLANLVAAIGDNNEDVSKAAGQALLRALEAGKDISKVFSDLSILAIAQTAPVKGRVMAAMILGRAMEKGWPLDAATSANLSAAVESANEEVSKAAGQALIKGFEARSDIGGSLYTLSVLVRDRSMLDHSRIMMIRILLRYKEKGGGFSPTDFTKSEIQQMRQELESFDGAETAALEKEVADLEAAIKADKKQPEPAGQQPVVNRQEYEQKITALKAKIKAMEQVSTEKWRTQLLVKADSYLAELSQWSKYDVLTMQPVITTGNVSLINELIALGSAMEAGLDLRANTMKDIMTFAGNNDKNISMAALQTLLKANTGINFLSVTEIVKNKSLPAANRILATKVLRKVIEKYALLSDLERFSLGFLEDLPEILKDEEDEDVIKAVGQILLRGMEVERGLGRISLKIADLLKNKNAPVKSRVLAAMMLLKAMEKGAVWVRGISNDEPESLIAAMQDADEEVSETAGQVVLKMLEAGKDVDGYIVRDLARRIKETPPVPAHSRIMIIRILLRAKEKTNLSGIYDIGEKEFDEMRQELEDFDALFGNFKELRKEKTALEKELAELEAALKTAKKEPAPLSPVSKPVSVNKQEYEQKIASLKAEVKAIEETSGETVEIVDFAKGDAFIAELRNGWPRYGKRWSTRTFNVNRDNLEREAQAGKIDYYLGVLRIGSNDEIDRVMAALVLGRAIELGRPLDSNAIQTLISTLGSSEGDLADAAGHALLKGLKAGRNINLSDLLLKLSDTLIHTDVFPQGRIIATMIVGRALEMGTSLGPRILQSLTQAVGDANEDVARAAGQALLKGTEAGKDIGEAPLQLSNLIKDASVPSKGSIMAAMILRRAIEKGKSINPVIYQNLADAIGDQDEEVAEAAGQALLKALEFGKDISQAFPDLVMVVTNNNLSSKGRIMAARILGRSIEIGNPLSIEVYAGFSRGIMDGNEEVAEAVGQAMINGLKRPDAYVSRDFSPSFAIPFDVVGSRKMSVKSRVIAAIFLDRAREIGWVLNGGITTRLNESLTDIQREFEEERSKIKTSGQGEKAALEKEIADLEAALKQGRENRSSSASSPLEQDPQAPGGIDLDPNRFDFQIKTEGDRPSINFEMNDLLNENFQGLSPVIINITPVPLPMFLSGLEETTQEVSLSR